MMTPRTEILSWREARERVIPLREIGFGRYGLGREDLSDSFDALPRALHLVASVDGKDVGCSRIVFGEIDKLPMGQLTRVFEIPGIKRTLLCEASHFSVPTCRVSEDVKIALWRTGFHQAVRRGAKQIILSTRKGGVPAYKSMLFEELGPLGEYTHEKRGNRKHFSLSLKLDGIEERFAKIEWLHNQFFGHNKDQNHEHTENINRATRNS